MIREAVERDRLRVVRLLKDSRAGAGFDDMTGPTGFTFPFVAAYAERMFKEHRADPNSLCLVYAPDDRPQGVLMAKAFEHMFGPVWFAQETLWWIDPAHRGKAAVQMLDAYEVWAKTRGCAFAGMAGMGADPIVARLYLRRGYRVAETNFLKAL
ncbi:acetyltransferase (GNAT) family protein [Pseudaminobacter salicylatoxidans]|uniref:Acetyltransferase (GNAT) family protein n=1 Tax=Pseudaminobacter salicylatoxidans TaxID=93369 RepID=A0A316BMV9_PSESE|nr:GNAT family N-acetyltransferase [Pseudaminobacter salicylatoxidans]PWJ73819.1 acetyltransferase (GNAT) family protein [Pseudaminobacter salicylatoxidans]